MRQISNLNIMTKYTLTRSNQNKSKKYLNNPIPAVKYEWVLTDKPIKQTYYGKKN